MTGRQLLTVAYFLFMLTCVAFYDRWWPLTLLTVVGWVAWLVPFVALMRRRRSARLAAERAARDLPWGTSRVAARPDDDPLNADGRPGDRRTAQADGSSDG